MKTRTLVNLASAVLLMGTMSAAQAAINVSLSTDSVTTAGGQVSLTFTLDVSGGDNTLGGGTDFFFVDPGVFSYVSWTLNPGLTPASDGVFTRAPDDCSVSTNPACAFNDSYGAAPSLMGMSFGNFGGYGDGTYTIGTLVLDVAAGLAAGFYGIDMANSDNEPNSPGTWQGQNGSLNPQPSFIRGGVQVNPVPLPAAAWLMIGGLASLMGFRRS